MYLVSTRNMLNKAQHENYAVPALTFITWKLSKR